MNSEKIIEFDKINELWMSFAMTDTAKQQIKEINPYLSEVELLTKLRETSEGKTMIEKCGNPPVVSLNSIAELLQIAEKGGCLTFFLVTTHYPEVKSYADKADCIVNARMTFDKEQLKPLYQMEIGEAGESCAFYIARRLGMSSKMLRRATEAAYGTLATAKGYNANRAECMWEIESDIEQDKNKKKSYTPHIKKKKEHKKRSRFLSNEATVL